MALLQELGTAVRRRRQEIGLSQDQLAGLAGLSRATINGLETGNLADLSSRRIERLANELGLAVGVVGTRHPPGHSASRSAARVASVSYASELPPPVLLDALRTWTVPPGYIPHLRALLQEAPVAILSDLAQELEQSDGIARADTWKRMRTLAAALQCDRKLWQLAPT